MLQVLGGWLGGHPARGARCGAVQPYPLSVCAQPGSETLSVGSTRGLLKEVQVVKTRDDKMSQAGGDGGGSELCVGSPKGPWTTYGTGESNGRNPIRAAVCVIVSVL